MYLLITNFTNSTSLEFDNILFAELYYNIQFIIFKLI